MDLDLVLTKIGKRKRLEEWMNKIIEDNNGIKYTKTYLRAQKRVKEIKGFYTHLQFTVLVISNVIILYKLKFEPHFHWFWFSTWVGE